MRAFAIFCSLVAVLVAAAWVIAKPGYDSVATAAAAMAALFGSFFLARPKSEYNQKTQSQTVAAGGTGLQVGRDVIIHEKKRTK